MTSLSLLQDYDSSSEDGEEPQKTSFILPAPNLPNFEISRAIRRPLTNTSQVDGTGKVRNFAHEAGNWATFVAIPVQITPDLDEFLELLEEKFAPFHLHQIQDCHISLTRVIVLRHHWINEFVNSLKTISGNTSAFAVMLHGLAVYTNDEKNRTFLALKITSGQTHLDVMVNQLDLLVRDYNLEKFYEDRSFHVSVFWAPGDVQKNLEALVSQNEFSSFTQCINLSSCFCKTGNKVYSFPFS